MGKCIRKGCQLYAIQVGYADSKEKAPIMEDIPVVQEFLCISKKHSWIATQEGY